MLGFGIVHVNVRTDGFTEAGGAALVALARSADGTRAWIGLDPGVRASYRFDNGASVFAACDGRFREGFAARSDTIGFAFTW